MSPEGSTRTSSASEKQKNRREEEFPPIRNLQAFLIKTKLQFDKEWENPEIPRADVKEFQWLGTLGEGAFGRVLLAKHKPSKMFCAVKVLVKSTLFHMQQISHAYSEMRVLKTLSFPFLVYLLHVMKDNSFLYFAMPFVIGGDMFLHLRALGKFSEEQTRFYAVQICLAIEYLHFLDILHRDIKPENILVDRNGYLKIADFGFCKIVKTRTYTFCGTPEYIAPEIISYKPYGKAVDWWSYGVLIYEMRSGYPPFNGQEPREMYDKILKGKYKNSRYFSKDLKNLISSILQVDPTKRLGNLRHGVNDIKDHKWFKDINWLSVLNCKVGAPYVPRVTTEAEYINFPAVPEVPLMVAEVDHYEKDFENF